MRYELKGRLITGPKNAQSIEVPASAIAAVAASEARRAASGRRTSDENRELGQQGPILEGPMPLNQMVARMWPDGQTENPPGYSHQGLILPGLYESDAPGATYGSGGMGAGMYASPRNSSSQPSGLNGNGAGGGGLTTPRNGTRSRSGTNASMTQMPNMNGTWSSASTGGSMGMPPVPGRNPQYPRANHIAEDSRPGRKMSDPSSGSRGPPGYGGGGSRPSPPPHHLPPPSSSRQPDKKKGGLFGKKNSKKDKDDKCLIM
ncbi:hypothetical protein DL93DRAFT_718675 [Clavulina sp. PMI_390]|nr:hypothetical protein DL93DRAFT_718675 [Clavulina sp. PMI_390]